MATLKSHREHRIVQQEQMQLHGIGIVFMTQIIKRIDGRSISDLTGVVTLVRAVSRFCAGKGRERERERERERDVGRYAS